MSRILLFNMIKSCMWLIDRSMCCSVVLRAGVVAMVVRLLGIPALAGEAIFCSGLFPSVVLTTAVYAILCRDTITDTSHDIH